MTYSEALGKGKDIIAKSFWLLLVPIISDIVLLLANYINYGMFIGTSGMLQIQFKFAIPSALPSLKNIVDAFPDGISFNTNTGWNNAFGLFSPNLTGMWSLIYIFCAFLLSMIISAFLEGGFLGCIAKTYREEEKASIKDFIYFGSYYWSRFLVLNIIGFLFILPAVVFPLLVFLYFFAIIPFFYLPYNMVWDDLSITDSISGALNRFFGRLGNSIGFMLYIGLLTALLSLFLIPVATAINVFIGLVIYNTYGSFISAAIMVMYADKGLEEVDYAKDDNLTE